MHSFLVPVLGHERGFSASAIGLVLGVFAVAVAVVRLAIPLIAQHLREGQVLAGCMLWTAGVFALLPVRARRLGDGPAGRRAGPGAGRGAADDHDHAAPAHAAERHGEAIALRSMTINFSSALMPLLFGALGAMVGASALFWLMGAAVGAGSWPARRVAAAPLRT